MNYEIKSQIEPILPKNKNKSFQLVWDILYFTRLLKYVHRRHYRHIRERLRMTATKQNLDYLCTLGYLKQVQEDIFCAKDKALTILKEVKYNRKLDLLPAEPVGNGDINELNNTAVFLQALKLKHFYTLLYPNFEYLKPDALLVLRNENAYKLTFLEIEQKKPNWQEYLDKKRDNYLRLAKDYDFYNYWKNTCVYLNLSIPDNKSLKFSVCFVGDIKRDFGNGFIFTSKLEA